MTKHERLLYGLLRAKTREEALQVKTSRRLELPRGAEQHQLDLDETLELAGHYLGAAVQSELQANAERIVAREVT